MAKFKNVDKRRLWETKEQKRKRNLREARFRLDQALGSVVRGFSRHLAAHSAIGEHAYPERARPLEDVLRAREKTLLVQPRKATAPPSAKEETWAEYFHFGLTFYRLQKWLRSLWATANFRRPSVWMTMRHLKEGGRHEIVAH